MRGAESRGIRPLDRVPCRQQMEQEHTDRVDLAGDRRRLPPEQQLRSHVGRRAAWIFVRPAFVGESEIHQQDPAALFPHHIAGLDIAVEESCRVYGANRPADIDADECGLTGTQWTLCIEKVRKRPALDEVAPEPDPSVVAAHAMDRHDVGVSHTGDGARFPE